MNIVKLHDKTFELFISNNEINDIVYTIADKINKSGIIDPLFVAVLNGSFLFAADIMRRINFNVFSRLYINKIIRPIFKF